MIAGLSMGGNTAIAYASAYPDKVDRLILADTTAWYGEDAMPAWEKRAQKVEAEGMEPVPLFNLHRWVQRRLPPTPTPRRCKKSSTSCLPPTLPLMEQPVAPWATSTHEMDSSGLPVRP